jgi:hypothetical protein
MCGVYMMGEKSDAVYFQKCLHTQSTVSKNKRERKCYRYEESYMPRGFTVLLLQKYCESD